MLITVLVLPIRYFLLLTPQEVTKKKAARMPWSKGCPQMKKDFEGTRQHDILSWCRSFSILAK